MINCKKHLIATCFTLMLPVAAWSAEAPVVDDSDNFAIIDGQQADEPFVAHPKYDEARIDTAQSDNFNFDNSQDDGPALVKEDSNSELGSGGSREFNDNAKLIDKVQTLQQEVQELRGQLEVQAHDLKLLQQQQIAFYKDLDARLGAAPNKSAQSKAITDMTLGSKVPEPAGASGLQTKTVKTVTVPPVLAVSRMNPADEQISYLAAYELVKNKKYDEAINAMQIFSQKYPKGGYTANAQYWLGELYLVKKDYPHAIEHFEVVLSQFPSSSKSAASMLKAGYAYSASGNNQEARQRLQQVVKNYPDTPTAQLARSKLEAIKAI